MVTAAAMNFIPQLKYIRKTHYLLTASLFYSNVNKLKDKPVETDNSAAYNDQANCETRKSDANDDSS